MMPISQHATPSRARPYQRLVNLNANVKTGGVPIKEQFDETCCFLHRPGGIAMSAREERYRRNAAEAERQALRATNEADKAAWLLLVRGWRGLLPKEKTPPNGPSSGPETQA